jgi:hypothetical protein
MNVSDRFRCYQTSSYYEERVRDLGSNSASEGFGLLFDYIHDPARTDKELDSLFGPMRLLMGRCQDIQSVRRDERKAAGDFRQHVESESCWCSPTRDDEEPSVIIHNSFDRREDYETGARKLA